MQNFMAIPLTVVEIFQFGTIIYRSKQNINTIFLLLKQKAHEFSGNLMNTSRQALYGPEIKTCLMILKVGGKIVFVHIRGNKRN